MTTVVEKEYLLLEMYTLIRFSYRIDNFFSGEEDEQGGGSQQNVLSLCSCSLRGVML